MKMLGKSIAVIGFAFALATGAFAASIVTNGSFETGDFTGWTQFGNTTFNGVTCPGGAPDGSCFGFFGPVGSVGGIQQLLTTVIGAEYIISFFLSTDGGTPSSFLSTFGGATLLSLTNPAASGFHLVTFDLVATSASTLLQFGFRDDPGFINLDRVSVSRVPEPASLALLGIALGVMALVRRRKLN